MMPTQSSIKWVLGALLLEVKGQKHEAVLLPLSHAKVRNAWIHTSTPTYIFSTGD
jgi:hypothetical protein